MLDSLSYGLVDLLTGERVVLLFSDVPGPLALVILIPQKGMLALPHLACCGQSRLGGGAPNLFQGMGVWRISMENQHSGHTPWSGPEVNNERSSTKNGAPERLRCGIIQKEMS